MPNEEIDLDLDAIDLDSLDFDPGGEKTAVEPAPVEVEVMEDDGAEGDSIEIDVEEMLSDSGEIQGHNTHSEEPLRNPEVGLGIGFVSPDSGIGIVSPDSYETIRPGDLTVGSPPNPTPAPPTPTAPAVASSDGDDIDALFKDLLAEEAAPQAAVELSTAPGTGAEWNPVAASDSTGFGAEWGPTAGLDAPPSFDADPFVLEPESEAVPELADELVPVLTLSADEPAPVPSPDLEALSDPDALRAFHKLAGVAPASTPEEQAAALRSALVGEAYDPAALPDAQTIAVGIGRLLAERMGSPDELLQAILGVRDQGSGIRLDGCTSENP